MIRLLRAVLTIRRGLAAAAVVGVRCWWCAHPETHDDDTGCQHPGCACSGLL